MIEEPDKRAREYALSSGSLRAELDSGALRAMQRGTFACSPTSAGSEDSTRFMCSCDGCALLFCGQSGAHYLRVPRRIRALSDFQMADLQWESLMIPINLAFFYRDSAADKMMAMYPSPAGAIESLLSLESWTEIAAEHPALQTMEPDVETFLVNRVGA